MFVSQKLVKFYYIRIVITFALSFIICLFCFEYSLSASILFGGLISFGAYGIDMMQDKNALVKIKIDETGMSNPHFKIKWEDISSYELIEVHVYKKRHNPFYKVEMPSVICIGECDKSKKFRKMDMSRCILFSMTNDFFSEIEKFGKGKSQAIDQILEYYYTK